MNFMRPVVKNVLTMTVSNLMYHQIGSYLSIRSLKDDKNILSPTKGPKQRLNSLLGVTSPADVAQIIFLVSHRGPLPMNRYQNQKRFDCILNQRQLSTKNSLQTVKWFSLQDIFCNLERIQFAKSQGYTVYHILSINFK